LESSCQLLDEEGTGSAEDAVVARGTACPPMTVQRFSETTYGKARRLRNAYFVVLTGNKATDDKAIDTLSQSLRDTVAGGTPQPRSPQAKISASNPIGTNCWSYSRVKDQSGSAIEWQRYTQLSLVSYITGSPTITTISKVGNFYSHSSNDSFTCVPGTANYILWNTAFNFT